MDKKMEKDLISMAIDAKEYPKVALNYAILYANMWKTDNERFYIRELNEAIEMMPDKYLRKRLIKFFNLNGKGVNHFYRRVSPTDVALQSLAMEANKATHFLRTMKGMYIYRQPFRNLINEISQKTRGEVEKDEFSNLERAKYAHIFYKYFLGPSMDGDEEGEKVSDIQLQAEGNILGCLTYEILKKEWEEFFSMLAQGDIILPAVEEFLSQLNAEEERAIRQDCQLGEYEDQLSYIHPITVRAIKEHIFSNGKWLHGNYMQLSSFEKISTDELRKMANAWRKYFEQGLEWKSETIKPLEVWVPTKGKLKINIPQFGKAYFVDEWEIMAFTNLMEILHKDLSGCINFHGKPMSEYDFFKIMLLE